MTYCDGCHDSDPMECGKEIAGHHRDTLNYFSEYLPHVGQRRLELEIDELLEHGCPCSCHDGAVDAEGES